MLGPSDPASQGSIDSFASLLNSAYRLREQKRDQEEKELVRRHRQRGALPHERGLEGSAPSAGISMDRELGGRPGVASKANGARKGLECESSAIRRHKRNRRAS